MENKGEQTKMELDTLTATKKIADKRLKEIEERLSELEKSVLQLYHEVNILYKAHK